MKGFRLRHLTIYSGFDSNGEYVEIKRREIYINDQTKETKIVKKENEEVDENVPIVKTLDRQFVEGGKYYDSVNGELCVYPNLCDISLGSYGHFFK